MGKNHSLLGNIQSFARKGSDPTWGSSRCRPYNGQRVSLRGINQSIRKTRKRRFTSTNPLAHLSTPWHSSLLTTTLSGAWVVTSTWYPSSPSRIRYPKDTFQGCTEMKFSSDTLPLTLSFALTDLPNHIFVYELPNLVAHRQLFRQLISAYPSWCLTNKNILGATTGFLCFGILNCTSGTNNLWVVCIQVTWLENCSFVSLIFVGVDNPISDSQRYVHQAVPWLPLFLSCSWLDIKVFSVIHVVRLTVYLSHSLSVHYIVCSILF